MLRSMWSGVAGLKTHQAEMDVISNNISNVNTTAYKSQQMNFTDLLYQAKKSAAAAANTHTGTNATQVGLGAKTGAIMTMIGAQGSIQTTNNPFDISISGDSFFTVADADNIYYTRDGSFTVDGTGYLVNQTDGLYVLGWRSTDGVTVPTGGNLQNLQLISDDTKTMAASATTAACFAGNFDRYDSLLSDGTGRSVKLEVYGTDGNTYTLNYVIDNAEDEIDTTFRATLTSVTDADGNAVEIDGNVDNTTVELVYDAATGTFTSANGNANGIVTFNFTGDAANVGSIAVDFTQTTSYAAKNNSSTVVATKGD
ncbi:MAG: flagellar hook-basal body complex protein, partial [Butyrivibrio sp.]|nr:flagellar hook-basal body complex protein [Butyrivibrio sp.]